MANSLSLSLAIGMYLKIGRLARIMVQKGQNSERVQAHIAGTKGANFGKKSTFDY